MPGLVLNSDHIAGWGLSPPSEPAYNSVQIFDQVTVFLALPTALFILASTLRCYTLRTAGVRPPRRLALLRVKLTLLALACVSETVSCFAAFAFTSPNSGSVLDVLALGVALPLTYLNHRCTRSSSTLLLLFLPVHVVWFALRYFLTGTAEPAKAFAAVLCFVVFVLECLGVERGEKTHCAAERPESPLFTANVFSVWSFSWLSDLLKRGSSTQLSTEDLYPLTQQDRAAPLEERLRKARETWKSLWAALILTYGGPYALAAVLKIIHDVLAFSQPQFLRWLLIYISRYQETQSSPRKGDLPVEGFAIVAAMFFASIAQTVILHQYFQICFETGMRVRSGIVTSIYQKSLSLANGHQYASGDILNLMSVDATRLQDLCTYGLILVSGPFQITLAFISLYRILGWSAFVGVAIMVFLLPFNTLIVRFLKRLQERLMKDRDHRTRRIGELLAHIRSIKFHAWENTFLRRVLSVRDNELAMLRKIGLVTSLNVAVWNGTPLLVAFASFAVASRVSATPLTPDIIFPSISLFMLLIYPLVLFGQAFTNIIEAVVSVKRVANFLAVGDFHTNGRRVIRNVRLEIGDEVLSVKDGEFRWSNDGSALPVLENIHLDVRKGELMGVMGRIGSGKTSLLSAAVGEMNQTRGEVRLYGRVAYVPQSPWMMSATIRENILFSHVYDPEFYDAVLHGKSTACALNEDLAALPDGDLTQVGEKGVTLSGGQRARVALARAVYARTELIVLDDVLSALDMHVARHVFDHVIGPSGLLSTKARLVTTNSTHFLRWFDKILYLGPGNAPEIGTFADLTNDPGSQLCRLIKEHSALETANGMSSGDTTSLSSQGSTTGEYKVTEEHGQTNDKQRPRRMSFGKAVLHVAPSASSKPAKEHSEEGRVKTDVYVQYIKAASRTGFGCYVVFMMLQQVLVVAGNDTLRAWSEHNLETGRRDGALHYLLIYGAYSLTSTAIGTAAAILLWVVCSVRSSRRLHNSMLNSIMRAPLSFFELTPHGRIVNVASKDTYTVDQAIAKARLCCHHDDGLYLITSQDVEHTVRETCIGVMIVSVIGYHFPIFLVTVLPLGWFYITVMRYYLATSRQLKRLEATSRSPVFIWFSETLDGLSTIRTFNQQSIFITGLRDKLDLNQACYILSVTVNRWLAVRLEFVGATVILVAAVSALFTLGINGVNAGLVGFVLSFASNITVSLSWLVRSASEVERNAVSVERMLHYINLAPEAPYETLEPTPEKWPAKGKIEFRSINTRYRTDFDFALKDVTLKINPGEKLGVCGRTGSGKSTLLLSLFRMLEPTSGSIYIDGVDIAEVGLHDLRSAISIVPQVPDVFEGSIRENIDPTGAYQDRDIWEAAHLRSYVEALPGGLDTPVRESGSSISSGERQLLCFARALLRKSKILVLDEATSAVDLDTDKLVQETLRGPEFADITIITIAHRLQTIMDCDRVLVLASGRVSELNTPRSLLEDTQSEFYSMAVEARLV
ncbi:metal resistance protein YCF1 [Rhodofomes roseus]|uniref:Metal resistance protein YCF1 n=1 Tax=Rhodofomes roseus TaxID=34475 RepID=A0ABQ8K1U0_9APHY|nr:metal resistance protein YCF1 [Rhodofomes roseus]KAH9830264.1 metal resistance protein YCF1 [Rhodofomes roseus]